MPWHALFTLLSSLLGDGGAAQPALHCANQITYGNSDLGETLLLWDHSFFSRLETLSMFEDGTVMLSAQSRTDGAVHCRAKLTPERLARFRSDFTRTPVCRVKSMKMSSKKERFGMTVDFGRPYRCVVELPAARWVARPETRAVQAVIDELRRELCGGPCPKP